MNNKLDMAEISHIAEFGHHPVQIFDKPHEMGVDAKGEPGPVLTEIVLGESNLVLLVKGRITSPLIERSNMLSNAPRK